MSDQSVDCSGDDANQQAPAQVTGVSSPWELALGSAFTCSLGSDKNVYCWGKGADLGYGAGQGDTPIPVEPIADADVLDVEAYGSYACALDHYAAPSVSGAGEPYCWGTVPGTATQQSTPTLYGFSDPIYQVAVSSAAACASGSYGGLNHLWCWGGGHSATQQSLLFDAGTSYSLSVDGTGRMCVQGTYSGSSTTHCYTGFQANGNMQ